MSGVGEASAIVGLIATAAQLSQAVIDIASKFKNARKQIEYFGQEVGVLGSILEQLERFYSREDLRCDEGVYAVTRTILDQCTTLFRELEEYKQALHTQSGSVRNIAFGKWVFNSDDLDVYRTRVESQKTNLLLMMEMRRMYGSESPRTDFKRQENERRIAALSLKANEYVTRLETLEEALNLQAGTEAAPAGNRMSVMTADTASEARSIRDSILSLYGHRSYHDNISRSGDGELDSGAEKEYAGRPSAAKRHGNLNPLAKISENETDVEMAEIQLALQRLRHSEDDVSSDQDSDHGEPDQDPLCPCGREHDISSFGTSTFGSSKLHKRLGKALRRLLPSQSIQFNEPTENWTFPIRAKSLWHYSSDDPDSGLFSVEEHETLMVQEVDENWWPAMTRFGHQGLIPMNYIVLL